MRQIAFILACLACEMNGRRPRLETGRLPNFKSASSQEVMKVPVSVPSREILTMPSPVLNPVMSSATRRHSALLRRPVRLGRGTAIMDERILKQRDEQRRETARSLIHPWFDPLERWGRNLLPQPEVSKQLPLLAYVVGLDGGNGSPFVQWPGLAKQFKLAVQDISFKPEANAASFEDIVEDVAAFLRMSRTTKRFLMGESYGGLVAAGVALRYPDLVSGLILVNPATAVSTLPELQEDIKWIRFGNIPDALVPYAVLQKAGLKTFDSEFFVTALREVLIDKKIEKLRASDPKLAAYYDAVLPDFVAQLTAIKPADYWRGRLAQLVDGVAYTNPRLRSLAMPVLVVAGGSDALLDSRKEAARLSGIIPICDTQIVDGAGHAGTLDARIDLPEVVRQWMSRRGLDTD